MARFLVLLAVLVAGFSISPVLGPTPAQAFGVCDIFDCGSFSVAPPDCTIGSVKVEGTPARHKYSFDRVCNGYVEARVTAVYDASGIAQEKLTEVSGLWTFTSRWNCADDPWIASGVPCANGKISTKGQASVYDGIVFNHPLSASDLSDQNRHVLAAQLNNALSAAAAPPAAPSVKNDKLLGKVEGATDALKQAIGGPDLTVIRIDGPSTLSAGESGTYSFIIGDVGTAGASVEVDILFAGVLDQTGQVSADSGLSCDSIVSSGKVNTDLHCTGGQLDPKRSATVTVQAVGMNPGAGSVIATINNSRSLAELDYGNNLGKRDVTIN